MSQFYSHRTYGKKVLNEQVFLTGFCQRIRGGLTPTLWRWFSKGRNLYNHCKITSWWNRRNV